MFHTHTITHTLTQHKHAHTHAHTHTHTHTFSEWKIFYEKNLESSSFYIISDWTGGYRAVVLNVGSVESQQAIVH
jgi:hypothetical protein